MLDRADKELAPLIAAVRLVTADQSEENGQATLAIIETRSVMMAGFRECGRVRHVGVCGSGRDVRVG